MKRKTANFAIDDCREFKIKMLNWSRRFNIFCFLDNSIYESSETTFDCLLAVGCEQSVTLYQGTDLAELQAFSDKHKDWLFGHFGYELFQDAKKEIKDKMHEVDFGKGFFFIPDIVLRLHNNNFYIESLHVDPNELYASLLQESAVIPKPKPANINLTYGIAAEEYKQTIEKIRGHILRGDCYEINFCQHFFAQHVSIDPYYYYTQLLELSPNPFAAFYKLNDKYCLCASPERFLKRSGNTLISQPIKGTIKRIREDKFADEQNKNFLRSSIKEQTENVMIVDLVRNDLSRICMEGSVFVKELFGVYSFPQVHQMISTIEGKLNQAVSWTDIIKACFPMGSMTGAPKIKVMELISQYEQYPRGLFSGSIGYLRPSGDFDFNVVIRSLMYDESKELISIKAGGGITFNSSAEEEYEESLLKAGAIMQMLKN